jgi:hypothetical protein
MTGHAVVVADGDSEARWQTWKARGAAADRRSTAVMGTIAGLLGAALGVSLLFLLAF